MTNPPPRKSTILVIGGGGAGLATAVAAAEAGAAVTLIERSSSLGGTTAYSVGSITAAGTSFQARKGITDNVDDLVEDMWKFDPDLLTGDNRELRTLYARESAATVEWLVHHGVQFTGPFPEAPHRVPRMHNVIPSSRAYIARLADAARRSNVEILLGTEATALVTDGDRVTGADVTGPGGSRSIPADAVVLATGDFSANAEMRAQHLPWAAAQSIPINPGALGIGHRLATSVGGALLRMDQLFGPQLRFAPPPKPGFLDRLPLWRWFTSLEGMVARAVPPSALRPIVKSLLVSHMSPTDALFRAGAILVDSGGSRFGTEAHPAAELSARPGGRGYIILDQRIADDFDHAPNHISTAPGIAFAYFTDYRRGRPDLVHRASDVAGLAMAIGVPAATLEQAVAGSGLTAPFIAMGPAFSMLTVTEGAVSVDADLRVLRDDGTVVDGLFAVGGVGQGGMLLKGHGHHIGWAMTSGRLLGRALAGNSTDTTVAKAPGL